MADSEDDPTGGFAAVLGALRGGSDMLSEWKSQVFNGKVSEHLQQVELFRFQLQRSQCSIDVGLHVCCRSSCTCHDVSLR